jgi:hypothetical protein
MQRIRDGIIVALLLVLAGYFFWEEPRRPIDPLTGKLPLAVAGLVQPFERGKGPNLAAQVASFAGGRWRLDQVAVVPGVAVAPDGSKTADGLVETSDYDRHRIETAVPDVTAGGIYTLSIYVRPIERNAMQFEMRGQKPGKFGIVQFNFNDKAVTYAGGDVSDFGMEALPGGWFRCWAAMPYSDDTAVFNFALLGWQSPIIYKGDKSAGLLIWGVQFEPGNRPRGYAASGTAQ